MEGFMVNTTNVNNCAYDIQGYGKRVEELQSSVRSIRSGMRHKLSAREQIDRTLRQIEDRLLEEAAFMSSLDKALEHIAESYRSTERKLVTEGIRRSAGGQEVTAQQQEMMDQYMQAAILDIMQEERFSQEAWENASIEERKEILNDLLDRMEKEMGISLDDIQFRSGEGLGFNGAYSFEDNYITLNEGLLKTGDPGSILTTLMHETRHAYQDAVCEDPDRFIVSKETIEAWQDSAAHYQEYMERGDYYSIATEADAMDFAGQGQRVGEKVFFSDLGDGDGLMYDKTYYVDQRGTDVMIGSGNSYLTVMGSTMSTTGAFIEQYDLKCEKGIIYDKYTGIVDGEEKTFYLHKWDGYAKLREGSRWGEEVTVEYNKNTSRREVIDQRDLSIKSDKGSSITGGSSNGKGGLMYDALGQLRQLDNNVVSSSLADAKKKGPVYHWICKGFLGAYDPIGAICDIGQGYLSGDAGMYMQGAINTAFTNTDSDMANMTYGAINPMSWIR